tara:strand:+ start:218 stop:451 length:234 start_codon:yes stop_codon:yes gene_type:complete
VVKEKSQTKSSILRNRNKYKVIRLSLTVGLMLLSLIDYLSSQVCSNELPTKTSNSHTKQIGENLNQKGAKTNNSEGT